MLVVRPRHPARRARLDGQDLDRAAPGADARPAGGRRPRRRRGRRSRAATSPRRTTWPRRCSRWWASRRRERMNGVDLSPLFDGQAAAQARLRLRRLRQLVLHPHARAGRCWARNKPARFHLFDTQQRPGRGTQRRAPAPAASCTGSTGSCAACGGRPALLQRRRPGWITCLGRMRQKSPETYEEKLAQLAGAARAGDPHQPAGGGEAARQGQADRPRADREAARPGLLRGARHLRPPPHGRVRHAATTGPGATPWSPATARSTAGRCACSRRTSPSSAARSAR